MSGFYEWVRAVSAGALTWVTCASGSPGATSRLDAASAPSP